MNDAQTSLGLLFGYPAPGFSVSARGIREAPPLGTGGASKFRREQIHNTHKLIFIGYEIYPYFEYESDVNNSELQNKLNPANL